MILSLLCRFIHGCCPGEVHESPKPEQAAASTTSADLGQREAKDEALRKEQLRHMAGGPAAKTTQQKKAKRRRR